MRFGLVGAGLTLLSYLTFVGLIHVGVQFLAASTIVWAIGVCISYALNRRFTFKAGNRPNLPEFGRFLVGYILQFLLASAIYIILIGRLGLKPTPAFLINLVATSSTNFVYMKLVAFPIRNTKFSAERALSLNQFKSMRAK